MGKSKFDLYMPIDSNISIPALKKDKLKSKEVKKSLQLEREAIAEIAKATLGSGRIKHDGDALHLGDLRIERKTRFTSRSLTVTAAELDKGERQRIDIFEINLQQRERTYYVLSKELYYKLIGELHDLSKRDS